MIVYHGTTHQSALKIRTAGFLPKAPSHRVWFARSRTYSLNRARTKARRGHDRPVVLTCEIDVSKLRERLGSRQIFYSNGIIAISGEVPAAVIRSHSVIGIPSTPDDLAAWVNDLLGLKSYKGVGRRHPGIERMSRWVINRMASQAIRPIRPSELLDKARQWLPEFFERLEIDPEDLLVLHKVEVAEPDTAAPAPAGDPREMEALDALVAASPRRRVRGLALLAELADPDLFDWCAMYLEDESAEVRVAALRTMLRCEEGDPTVIEPLADSPDKRLRAAAIAALARHAGDDASYWFAQGLKDPDACVRLETASLLTHLDPVGNRELFELALYDPNPQVARVAQKLTAGKGLAKVKW
jgi:hypothetical protein